MYRALMIPLLLLTLCMSSAFAPTEVSDDFWEAGHEAALFVLELDFGTDWNMAEPELTDGGRIACTCHGTTTERHDAEAVHALSRENDLDFYWLQPQSVSITYPAC